MLSNTQKLRALLNAHIDPTAADITDPSLREDLHHAMVAAILGNKHAMAEAIRENPGYFATDHIMELTAEIDEMAENYHLRSRSDPSLQHDPAYARLLQELGRAHMNAVSIVVMKAVNAMDMDCELSDCRDLKLSMDAVMREDRNDH